MAVPDIAQQCLLWSAVWGAVAGAMGPRAYAARHAVHDAHAVLVCVGVCVWPDAAMAMTWGYYVVDLLVCLVNRDAMFAAHALAVLLFHFRYAQGQTEVALLWLCCISTPFYHWAQRAPASAPRWVLFFLAFAAVRVVGLPLWWFSYSEDADLGVFAYVVARCMYALQLAWFAGLLPIVARKVRPGGSVLDTAYPLLMIVAKGALAVCGALAIAADDGETPHRLTPVVTCVFVLASLVDTAAHLRRPNVASLAHHAVVFSGIWYCTAFGYHRLLGLNGLAEMVGPVYNALKLRPTSHALRWAAVAINVCVRLPFWLWCVSATTDAPLLAGLYAGFLSLDFLWSYRLVRWCRTHDWGGEAK